MKLIEGSYRDYIARVAEAPRVSLVDGDVRGPMSNSSWQSFKAVVSNAALDTMTASRLYNQKKLLDKYITGISTFPASGTKLSSASHPKLIKSSRNKKHGFVRALFTFIKRVKFRISNGYWASKEEIELKEVKALNRVFHLSYQKQNAAARTEQLEHSS